LEADLSSRLGVHDRVPDSVGRQGEGQIRSAAEERLPPMRGGVLEAYRGKALFRRINFTYLNRGVGKRAGKHYGKTRERHG